MLMKLGRNTSQINLKKKPIEEETPVSLENLNVGAVFCYEASAVHTVNIEAKRWRNLIETPADGNLSSMYDLRFGDGVNTNTFPNYVTELPDERAYFEGKAGPYFRLANNTNTDFINTLHTATTGGFWAAFIFKPTTTEQTDTILATGSSSSSEGMAITTQSSRRIRMLQYANSGVVGAFSSYYTAEDVHVVVFSRDHVAGNVSYWVNRGEAESTAVAYRSPALMTPGILTVMNNTLLTDPLGVGGRLYTMAVGNKSLTDIEALSVANCLLSRQGFTI
jgi:hypothetical protein